jgi:hypothetical protein
VAAVIRHSADLGSELTRSAKNKLADRCESANRGAEAEQVIGEATAR